MYFHKNKHRLLFLKCIILRMNKHESANFDKISSKKNNSLKI